MGCLLKVGVESLVCDLCADGGNADDDGALVVAD